MVFGHVIAADAVFQQLLFGNLPHTRNLLAGKDADVVTRGEQLFEEAFHTVRTRESEDIEVRERAKVGRRDPRLRGDDIPSFNHRGFDDFGTEGRETGRNTAGLLGSTRHHEALARKR